MVAMIKAAKDLRQYPRETVTPISEIKRQKDLKAPLIHINLKGMLGEKERFPESSKRDDA